MKIIDELKGKEIIDAKGNILGNISDVNWNPESNQVKSIIVTQGRAAKIGLGKKLIIYMENIDLIGDKILLKA
ncbi:MAG: PRC-barrel domain-containing protein [Methanobacteriaceae archaeon]|nr:PRC-barrel domain-containing protein [Methanobacteriaceae archaeon]